MGIGVRVVSMPSSELFEQQSQDYRDFVLPPDVTRRVTVEAGCRRGWERYAGKTGRMVGMDGFGLSAPFKDVYHYFGFTPKTLVNEVTSLLVPVVIGKGIDG
jgi:transketolase